MAKKLFFPPDFIDKVKGFADLSDIASSYTALKSHGKNHQGCCPFHSDKTPSFTVNTDKQIYTCFSGCEGSGGTGDVFQFIMRIENLTFNESVEFLAKRLSIPLPEQKSYQKTAVEIAREKTLSELFDIFIDSKKTQCSEYKNLLDQLHLSEDMLQQFGVTLGYTSDTASQINEAYKGKDNVSIYEAQKLGLLNSHGLAPFEDNSIVFRMGDTITEGLGFFDANGEFSYTPIRSHQFNDHVFGLNHFNKHAYHKTEGQKRIVGDTVFIAPTPLMAYQILSRGIPNVVAPLHHSSYSLPNFRERISLFINKTYIPAVSYIITDEVLNTTEVVGAISHKGLSSVPLNINFKTPINPESFDFLLKINQTGSYMQALDDEPSYKTILDIESSLDLMVARVMRKAILKSGIDNAEQMFGTKKTQFIEAMSYCIGAECTTSLDQDYIINALTSKVGINKSDLLACKYPGISELSQKRINSVNLVLAASICDPKFASQFSSDSLFSAIESLPNSFTPNEKLQLATYSIETTDAALAPLFNINKHIASFPKLIHPDEPVEQREIAGIIKKLIIMYKESSKSFAEIGNESLEALKSIEADLAFDISTLLNYQEQFEIDLASNKDKSESKKLELIEQINNNVIRLRR